ncbi:MAG: 8-amino-7-oxononanoate synthase [Gammaproteobacteria bacterium]|nr:MAG: 8-amino-7-oxononanoate synthase [Gammaproteobacteria bacterium]
MPLKMAAFVEERKRQSLYRSRRLLETPQGARVVVDGRSLANFSSNDYLGLANHPKVIQAFKKGADEYGVGSGASHLVVGHSRAHHQLEEQLADFVGTQRALLFSSGYMANVGAINSLAGRGDLVLQDKLNHASLLDGGLLSAADMKRYNHCDLDSLVSRLQAGGDRQALIVTDAVFSMDGDIAPLAELSALSAQHQALLMVDDAHGFGVLGQQGQGTVNHLALGAQQVPVYMATLGKALGVCGAFIAADHDLIDYLIQMARTYIYTTALPPAAAVAASASLQMLKAESWRQAHLRGLINKFRTGLSDWQHLLMPSETAIQPLLIGCSQTAIALSDRLLQQGFLVSAIRPPTVPKDTARLRITLSAAHSEQQVDELVNALLNLLPVVINDSDISDVEYP